MFQETESIWQKILDQFEQNEHQSVPFPPKIQRHFFLEASSLTSFQSNTQQIHSEYDWLCSSNYYTLHSRDSFIKIWMKSEKILKKTSQKICRSTIWTLFPYSFGLRWPSLPSLGYSIAWHSQNSHSPLWKWKSRHCPLLSRYFPFNTCSNVFFKREIGKTLSRRWGFWSFLSFPRCLLDSRLFLYPSPFCWPESPWESQHASRSTVSCPANNSLGTCCLYWSSQLQWWSHQPFWSSLLIPIPITPRSSTKSPITHSILAINQMAHADSQETPLFVSMWITLEKLKRTFGDCVVFLLAGSIPEPELDRFLFDCEIGSHWLDSKPHFENPAEFQWKSQIISKPQCRLVNRRLHELFELFLVERTYPGLVFCWI